MIERLKRKITELEMLVVLRHMKSMSFFVDGEFVTFPILDIVRILSEYHRDRKRRLKQKEGQNNE